MIYFACYITVCWLIFYLKNCSIKVFFFVTEGGIKVVSRKISRIELLYSVEDELRAAVVTVKSRKR